MQVLRGKNRRHLALMINSKTHVLPFSICALILFCHLSFGVCHPLLFAEDIKYPNVAGAFYPGNPQELSQLIDNFLAAANPQPIDGDIFALISPHAGYAFSGRVAAFGYRLVKNKPYKTVIVIGPSHHYGFGGISVYPGGTFRTPLGDLEIDSEFTRKLLDKDIKMFFQPRAFQEEHSIEVQLPFLQKVISGFKIVPLVVGDCSFSECQRLARLIKDAIGNRKDILVVASTDMYHGYNYQEAGIVDDLTLSYMRSMQPEVLYQKLSEGKAQLCGGLPVVITQLLAKELGHNKLIVLEYMNSAAVTGQKISGVWTVGYSSCVIDEEEACLPAGREEAMLNNTQRSKLLEIARSSIEYYLKTGKKVELAENDPVLIKEMGTFVTLHAHGELRGCIGNIIGDKPLYLNVSDMAVEAAVRDPRFPPVGLAELKDIEMEVSVLTPLEKVNSPDQIQLGKHGVLVRRGSRSGVFLPQVATETGWSKEEFLANLCAHKAGLAPDAWKDKATDLFIFSAEVFSEKEY